MCYLFESDTKDSSINSTSLHASFVVVEKYALFTSVFLNHQLGECKHYVQTDRIAIVSRLRRNFACAYIGTCENELLRKTT